MVFVCRMAALAMVIFLSLRLAFRLKLGTCLHAPVTLGRLLLLAKLPRELALGAAKRLGYRYNRGWLASKVFCSKVIKLATGVWFI